MILSLEEDEQEELQDVAQGVVTLDGELMAVNGRVLAGNAAAAGLDSKTLYGKKEPDVASVCSCTCYGNKPKKDPTRKRRIIPLKGKRNPKYETEIRSGCRINDLRTGAVTTARPIFRTNRFLRSILRIFGFRRYQGSYSDDSNYYDEETQSISNIARHAVKRSSL